MGFGCQELKRILKALQKNTLVESVNLGNVTEEENYMMMKEVLELDTRQFQIDVKDIVKETELKEIHLREHYINAGLLKRVNNEIYQR